MNDKTPTIVEVLVWCRGLAFALLDPAGIEPASRGDDPRMVSLYHYGPGKIPPAKKYKLRQQSGEFVF
jgi:hypothetical protein